MNWLLYRMRVVIDEGSDARSGVPVRPRLFQITLVTAPPTHVVPDQEHAAVPPVQVACVFPIPAVRDCIDMRSLAGVAEEIGARSAKRRNHRNAPVGAEAAVTIWQNRTWTVKRLS